MSKRIQQRVNINGETKWISGSTQQEIFEAYLAQAIKSGLVIGFGVEESNFHMCHSFDILLSI